MTHEAITRDEFTHQAEAMASHTLFTSGSVVDWFRDSLEAQEKGRVLDLACGPGIVTAELAPHADKIVGVDLTPRMLELARERSRDAGHTNAEFREASAEDLPFDSGAFDCVVTRLSFHHFEDVPKVLSEIARVLRPDGVLLVADIVSSSDPSEARLQNAFENLRDPSHVWMFDENELIGMLEEAGLSVQSTKRAALQREFAEWATLVANARSLDSLETVMREFAGAGFGAGIDLRVVDDTLQFVHHWRLVSAKLRTNG